MGVPMVVGYSSSKEREGERNDYTTSMSRFSQPTSLITLVECEDPHNSGTGTYPLPLSISQLLGLNATYPYDNVGVLSL